MYSNLIANLKSTEDRDIMIEELSLLKNALFEPKDGGLEHALSSDVRAWVADIIRAEIGDNPEEYLTGLINRINSLNEVNITLAIEPSLRILEVLHSWVRTNLGDEHILNISINESLLGGAEIAYGGKYYDGSLLKTVTGLIPQK